MDERSVTRRPLLGADEREGGREGKGWVWSTVERRCVCVCVSSSNAATKKKKGQGVKSRACVCGEGRHERIERAGAALFFCWLVRWLVW